MFMVLNMDDFLSEEIETIRDIDIRENNRQVLDDATQKLREEVAKASNRLIMRAITILKTNPLMEDKDYYDLKEYVMKHNYIKTSTDYNIEKKGYVTKVMLLPKLDLSGFDDIEFKPHNCRCVVSTIDFSASPLLDGIPKDKLIKY